MTAITMMMKIIMAAVEMLIVEVNQVKMSVSTSTSVWWGTGAASTSATTLRGVIGVPAGPFRQL